MEKSYQLELLVSRVRKLKKVIMWFDNPDEYDESERVAHLYG